jgi:hypothetical protein
VKQEREIMGTRNELEGLLTGHMLARGLGRVQGVLEFVHKDQNVTLTVDETIYRGYFITVIENGQKVREFRAGVGGFNWGAIAATIMEVAERRLKPKDSDAKAGSNDAYKQPVADLWNMIGAGLSSHISMEPSQATPGRVRVKLHELDLEPMAALRLYAAVSSVLSPPDTSLPA